MGTPTFKKALPPLKKIASLGPLETPKLQSVKEKQFSESNTPENQNEKTQLSLAGKGNNFLKTTHTGERGNDEEDQFPETYTVVHDSEQELNVKSILKMSTTKVSIASDSGTQSQQTKTLRKSMIQREDKRIMFNLDANVEFVTEVRIL